MCEWNVEIRSITAMRSCISDLCQSIFAQDEFSQEKQYHIKLALNEMVSNALIHSGQARPHVRVNVHLGRDGQVQFQVHCAPADPQRFAALQEAVERAGAPADLLCETGRGLRILSGIAKQLSVAEDGSSVTVLMDATESSK